MRTNQSLLIAFLLLASLSLATNAGAATGKRTAANSPSTTTWVKRFPLVYLDTAWTATHTRDGNVVVAMQTLGRDFKSNAMAFAKLSPAGKVLWLKRLPNSEIYGAQNCELPMKLREAADGTLLVAGSRCKDSWTQAWFARLGANGDLRWEVRQDKSLPVSPGPVPTQSSGWDIVEWPDGGLLGLALGFGGKGNLWMLDIGADGVVARSRTDHDNMFDEYWWGISTAGHVGKDIRIGFTSGGSSVDARIGRLDRAFNFRDEASLTGKQSEEMRGLEPTPDGGFCTLLDQDRSLFVQRHEADGTLRWRHPMRSGHGTRILGTRDGGCLLAGGAESGGASLRLLKYSADGQELWRQEIAGRWTPKSLLETPAGGLVVTGMEVPANYQGSVAYVLHIAAPDLGKAKLKPAKR
jgi:hypothetical protein